MYIALFPGSVPQFFLRTVKKRKVFKSGPSSPAPSCDCRCAKEWQLAVQLYQESRECQLVVAAVGVCSRPEPLKSFLYLDFMDPSKHSNVWGKLLETIGKTYIGSVVNT